MNAFGIVAIFISVLGVFTPIVGVFLSGISGFFALFALKEKDTLAQSSIILNLLNLTILSPMTFGSVLSKSVFIQNSDFKVIYAIVFLIQIVGVVLWRKHSRANDTTKDKHKPKKRFEPKF